MTEPLGHHKHKSVTTGSGNTRNAKCQKAREGEFGELPIKIPRDCEDSFEPQIIPKHHIHWTGYDDKIISL
jgi:putative transposase